MQRGAWQVTCVDGIIFRSPYTWIILWCRAHTCMDIVLAHRRRGCVLASMICLTVHLPHPNLSFPRCDCPRGLQGPSCQDLSPPTKHCVSYNGDCGQEVPCTSLRQALCINHCNGRGVCVAQFCHCYPGGDIRTPFLYCRCCCGGVVVLGCAW